MADISALEVLQTLHRDLLSICEIPQAERRPENFQILVPSLDAIAGDLRKLLDKPARNQRSREAVQSGKVNVSGEEWSINSDFQEIALQLADELDLDEIDAARLALEAEEDVASLGNRPLRECAIIRFHQRRKYLLSCMRLLIELATDDELPNEITAELGGYVDQNIFGSGPGAAGGAQGKFVPRCMASMQDIRSWLQGLADRVTSASVVGNAGQPEFRETAEFSRISLIQQHELLAVILCSAIERRQAEEKDLVDLITALKRADKYDFSIAHYFPVLGTYITIFGSTEGGGDVEQARKLNDVVSRLLNDDSRQMPFLNGAMRVWWLAEYSGWYMDDAAGSIVPGIDIDEEDRQRSKHFIDALKDGAFDFIMSMAADIKTSEWYDPARGAMRQWLQRKSPSLPSDTIPFSDFFQKCMMTQLEVLIDAFISNMPDVLRKLRSEEDEQRQLSQMHEQDYDLERFLLIIAYAYEGRPDAADAFWSDPESNLNGFLQWASKRASTPLIAAFCEMLQAISEDSECATSAHEFLLDEGAHASGKMRRSLSLTWAQVLKELSYFTNKVREGPVSTQTQGHRAAKFTSEHAEVEPESHMLVESFLRLIAKLASNSDNAKAFLLQPPKYDLIPTIFQLSSSTIPPRIRACAFGALQALLARKTQQESCDMWHCLESWANGRYLKRAITSPPSPAPPSPMSAPGEMTKILISMSHGFEEPHSFIQLIIALTTPPEGYGPLNDTLPFPENLGANSRVQPGIEPYIDYVLGQVFAIKVHDTLIDEGQRRILRYDCLEFALTCLATFNEDLIVFANETNIAVDSAIVTSNLASYVCLHPFARVMEWMFDKKVMASVLDAIHQDSEEIGNASPESPLILGILRAVEIVTKLLELQATYVDLVRPVIKQQNLNHVGPNSNSSYTSFEDGLLTRLNLVADLSNYCRIGHPDLTLACLKLLEKISTSPRIIAAWHPGSERRAHRNKAIVSMETNSDVDAVAGSFAGDLGAPLDFNREADCPNYITKIYILDFLYSCIHATPDRPTIAHLILGFQCGADSLSIANGGSFDSRASLFHTLLGVLLEVPVKDDQGVMRQWLISLKYKTMRVLRLLWASPLSSSIVVEELRENEFLFHLLLQGLVVQPDLIWDGMEAAGPQFLTTPAADGFVDYLSMRAMTLDYITMELCSLSQTHQPSLKRRVFDALSGQITVGGTESIPVSSIFEFHDFLPQEEQFAAEPPQLSIYRDLNIAVCREQDEDSNPTYNVDKVREILLLKSNETRASGQVIPQQDLAPIEEEEATLIAYVVYLNRFTQVNSYSLKVLSTWTKLLLVMTESNDFKGTNEVSFILQALQAVLPSLELYSAENTSAAFELAKLAKVLLFKLDFASMSSASTDKQTQAIGNLVSDKLYQLFQICLNAVARWAGTPELRAIYYSICYRYLTGLVDHGRGQGALTGRHRTAKSIQVFGEKLLNVVCDDAFCGDAHCQTAALILLSTLINIGKQEGDLYVVEGLNRLNFIGVLVDSLRNVMQDWISTNQANSNSDLVNYHAAKLALLLQLCQTRDGAKYVIHAQLFRAIDSSGLFTADPELQVDTADPRALESHYALLVKVARIIGAAIVSRGSHNVAQGRKFLTEHRMLVMHVLKRSAGIGVSANNGDGSVTSVRMARGLEERVDELAEAFMVIITATGFLEFESEAPVQQKRGPLVFH